MPDKSADVRLDHTQRDLAAVLRMLFNRYCTLGEEGFAVVSLSQDTCP